VAGRAILIDSATHTAVADRFATESLGQVPIRGKSKLVDIFSIAFPQKP
jgi:class 3 adenylate cyclase